MQIFGPRLDAGQQLCVIVGLTYIIDHYMEQAQSAPSADMAGEWIRTATDYIDTYRRFTWFGAHRRWTRRRAGMWVRQSCDILLEKAAT